MLVFRIVKIIKLDKHVKLCLLLYDTAVIDMCNFVHKCWYEKLTHPTLQLSVTQIALYIYYIFCWAIIQPALSHCSNEEFILHQIILKWGYASNPPPFPKLYQFYHYPVYIIHSFIREGEGLWIIVAYTHPCSLKKNSSSDGFSAQSSNKKSLLQYENASS